MSAPSQRVVKIGDIVTVVSEESMYHGEQGEVVEINDGDDDGDGPIGVKFDPWQILYHVSQPEECIVQHRDDQLRVDSGWSCKTLAPRLYPHYYHTTISFQYPFDPALPCMHEGCREPLARRCVFNIVGSVCEVDLCCAHATEIHGKCGMSFPWKKNYPFPKKETAA